MAVRWTAKCAQSQTIRSYSVQVLFYRKIYKNQTYSHTHNPRHTKNGFTKLNYLLYWMQLSFNDQYINLYGYVIFKSVHWCSVNNIQYASFCCRCVKCVECSTCTSRQTTRETLLLSCGKINKHHRAHRGIASMAVALSNSRYDADEYGHLKLVYFLIKCSTCSILYYWQHPVDNMLRIAISYHRSDLTSSRNDTKTANID